MTSAQWTIDDLKNSSEKYIRAGDMTLPHFFTGLSLIVRMECDAR